MTSQRSAGLGTVKTEGDSCMPDNSGTKMHEEDPDPPYFARRRSHLTKPLEEYRREVRLSLQSRRLELIQGAADWIRFHEDHVLSKFANGASLNVGAIRPELEVCETAEQTALWRYVRLLGTIPYSDYVGRRIRFLVRDGGQPNRPVMAIAALGSTVLQCPPRDYAIGWQLPRDLEIKSDRLITIMDLFVSIAAPPYNELTAGKLVCYMMLSNEVRSQYAERYRDVPTRMQHRTNTDLVLLNTTSLYGASVQYNRLRFRNQLAYRPVGFTSGYGNAHVGEQEFQDMLDYLRSQGDDLVPSYKWGAGSSWRMRVIRVYWRRRAREERQAVAAGNEPTGDSDAANGQRLADRMLHHQHQRQVFIAPLAANWREFLQGKCEMPEYYDWPLKELVDHWQTRWADRRISGERGAALVNERLRSFSPTSIRLSALLPPT